MCIRWQFAETTVKPTSAKAFVVRYHCNIPSLVLMVKMDRKKFLVTFEKCLFLHVGNKLKKL
jgi:hypothetical protein